VAYGLLISNRRDARRRSHVETSFMTESDGDEYEKGRMTMDKDTVIAQLEERQDEETFEEARRVLDAELAQGESAGLLLDYGYIHECRGRASIREAIRWYERSLELDPTVERTRHQLIEAYAALQETDHAIELHKRRLAEAPNDVAEYRFLAHAYLAAGEYEEAGKVVDAGLELDEDVGLLEQQGSVLAGQGRPEEALATWERVCELDGARISARYSRAFLLERLGRLTDAAAEWETIIAWLRERDYDVQAEWPERELERLRAAVSK
jgi:tetratricopeptide (TPR) repeat protein